MAKLVANECARCKRPVGFVTKDAFQIPTFCLLCAIDPEARAEWGHTVPMNLVRETLLDYYFRTQELYSQLRKPNVKHQTS
jgi:hypothetical protein